MSFRTLTLLENSGAATSAGKDWGGGYGCLFGEGSFNGGSMALEAQTPNGTWIAVGTATTLTANGLGGFFLPECKIRVVTTLGTGFYAYVRQMNTPTISGQ